MMDHCHWTGSELVVVSANTTIDNNGLTITPTTTEDDGRAYRFVNPVGTETGKYGLYGYTTAPSGTQRTKGLGLYVRTNDTAATAQRDSIAYVISEAVTSGGTDRTAITAVTGGTTNVVLSSRTFSPSDRTIALTLQPSTQLATLTGGNLYIAAGGVLSASPSAGVGYASGAGGSVTQTGSKSGGLTLNTICGEIVMHGAALAGQSIVNFTLTNNTLSASDLLLVQHVSGGTLGAYGVTATPGSGAATIYVSNLSSGSLSEAIVLRFVIVRAATS
jgi:hypothetical protein